MELGLNMFRIMTCHTIPASTGYRKSCVPGYDSRSRRRFLQNVYVSRLGQATKSLVMSIKSGVLDFTIGMTKKVIHFNVKAPHFPT